ncbi:MAG: hypothetical protein DI628_03975 [Blastochloris viridis]|uniref:Transmembrane protein n=1 Tax=Blastochloris viridis TaxID=1079 RepID=A0A6N4RCP3_BLAVI|nr:MAG: hypothetical protein DI628_03975 [Blastochloris viridis]
MAFRIFMRAFISFIAAVPLAFTSVQAAPFAGIGSSVPALKAPAEIVQVASKKKKKKPRYAQRNIHRDQLIGRVPARRSHQGVDPGMALFALGAAAILGGAIAGNGGSRYRVGHHRGGGYYGGNNCGVQYWTPNPGSPVC